MQGEAILSEANAGPATRGVIEAGTITDPEQRGRGYATIVSARTVLECERLGYQTYWNCAEDNPASAAIARKLGYRHVEEYRMLVWPATTTDTEQGGNDGS
jgi:RimJ/RimL family protein N-acetyltransferase